MTIYISIVYLTTKSNHVIFIKYVKKIFNKINFLNERSFKKLNKMNRKCDSNIIDLAQNLTKFYRD